MLSDTQFWKLLRQELLPLKRLGLRQRAKCLASVVSVGSQDVMTYSERPMHFISCLPRSTSTLLPSVLFRLDRKDGASTEMAGSRSREKTGLNLRSSVFLTLSSQLQADSPLRAFEN
ncbi:hypothetical protein J2X84_004785 [Pseudomonas corrugata]|jgi:hypothetical protein|nr:hypothetical protein [Pseudomonas corrugata]